MPLFGPPNIEKLKEKGDIEGLLRALGSASPTVLSPKELAIRVQAATALGNFGDDRVVQALMEVVTSEHGWQRDIQAAAAQALGAIGDPSAADTLGAALRDPRDHRAFRREAAQALLRLRQGAGIPHLVAALRGYGHEDAAAALHGMEDPDIEEQLQQHRFRWQLKSRDVEEFLASGDVDSLGKAAIESINDTVRSDAIEALGKVGGPRAAEHLMSFLEHDDVRYSPDWDAAIKALASCGQQAVGQLITVLEETRSPGTITGVARVLEEIGDRRAVEPLLSWLSGRGWVWEGSDGQATGDAARWVLSALGRLSDRRATSAIVDILSDGIIHLGVFAAAESALRDLRDPGATEPLIRLLGSDNLNVREAAAGVLGEIKDERAVAPLVPLLQDEYDQVQEAAADALERIGGPEAEAALAKYRARDESSWS